jgi:hypothetical protein
VPKPSPRRNAGVVRVHVWKPGGNTIVPVYPLACAAVALAMS